LLTFLNVAEDVLHCLGGASGEAGIRGVAHPQEGRWGRVETATEVKLTASFSGDVTLRQAILSQFNPIQWNYYFAY
jgi:hypothetical protein